MLACPYTNHPVAPFIGTSSSDLPEKPYKQLGQSLRNSAYLKTTAILAQLAFEMASKRAYWVGEMARWMCLSPFLLEHIIPLAIANSPFSFIFRFRFIQTSVSRRERAPKLVPFNACSIPITLACISTIQGLGIRVSRFLIAELPRGEGLLLRNTKPIQNKNKKSKKHNFIIAFWGA